MQLLWFWNIFSGCHVEYKGRKRSYVNTSVKTYIFDVFSSWKWYPCSYSSSSSSSSSPDFWCCSCCCRCRVPCRCRFRSFSQAQDQFQKNAKLRGPRKRNQNLKWLVTTTANERVLPEAREFVPVGREVNNEWRTDIGREIFRAERVVLLIRYRYGLLLI